MVQVANTVEEGYTVMIDGSAQFGPSLFHAHLIILVINI